MSFTLANMGGAFSGPQSERRNTQRYELLSMMDDLTKDTQDLLQKVYDAHSAILGLRHELDALWVRRSHIEFMRRRYEEKNDYEEIASVSTIPLTDDEDGQELEEMESGDSRYARITTQQLSSHATTLSSSSSSESDEEQSSVEERDEKDDTNTDKNHQVDQTKAYEDVLKTIRAKLRAVDAGATRSDYDAPHASHDRAIELV
jgi:hypothetical protein